MKKARFTTEQIVVIMQEHAAGAAPGGMRTKFEAGLQITGPVVETLRRLVGRPTERRWLEPIP